MNRVGNSGADSSVAKMKWRRYAITFRIASLGSLLGLVLGVLELANHRIGAGLILLGLGALTAFPNFRLATFAICAARTESPPAFDELGKVMWRARRPPTERP